ncbi:TetR/AcrR family transcriptional regulator [Bradyrhizobium sp. IC3069]|uniref:TetR/AcrR family transcriptional regulator n=1 Tax=unclassified Bradyrhizobium TaxID=2631580 RepID=UPI001CD456C5|nr:MULTISPECIES: TetR/AcrR family transcriptional regulator [unclassified Bradyrhizobium]MCA1362990.1 TetR/AcrR family transcriptional regulator [Bradyrhizobium sp. IC4059]MCA1521878.1 TetR/AcrR family transcriptional regulator [Bradyrhizobium sp. IC3069]
MKKRAPAAKRSTAPTRPRPEVGYHHGELQEALIAASEAILAEQGAEAFTLREAARRAGVSPAAPSHHFGNAQGLLTEVAIRGYDALAGALREAASGKQGVRDKLHAQGLAYVDYALRHPGRFQMMFANKRLVADDARLKQASRAAGHAFEVVVAELTGGTAKEAKTAAAAAWSTVHGFAKLALEEKFGSVNNEAGRREIMMTLDQVLNYLWPASGTRR